VAVLISLLHHILALMATPPQVLFFFGTASSGY